MRQGRPHPMHSAPLKAGVEHLGGGGAQALVVVRDHQLDAAQAAGGERAQETLPEHLRRGGTRSHAQNPSASESAVATPSTSRRPSVFTPTAIIVAIETMRPPSRAFT